MIVKMRQAGKPAPRTKDQMRCQSYPYESRTHTKATSVVFSSLREASACPALLFCVGERRYEVVLGWYVSPFP